MKSIASLAIASLLVCTAASADLSAVRTPLRADQPFGRPAPVIPLDTGSTNPASYEWGNLAPGEHAYIDRDYRYTSLPAAYVGLTYLRTANNDKYGSGDAFLTFQVNIPVTVYVAVDTRVFDALPGWLDSWVDTGEMLITDLPEMRMLRKDFAAGQVALGGNEVGFSMYTVVVSPAGVPGTPTAVPDIAQTTEDSSVEIVVLANDFGLEDTPINVSILATAESNGTVQVQASNSVLYTPAPGFFGQDSFVYHVADADGDDSSVSVSVEVMEYNDPPTISGTPPTEVLADHTYSFVPSASDPNGDALTFSIVNKPAWATFNSGTGALTGTPGGADLGSYGSIVMSVSDGENGASLRAISIDVVAAGNGTATLSWTPPTENEDGTPLDDLAGYKVYYGTSANSYSTTIDLSNPGLSSYVVGGLATTTTYYFAVSAYDAFGKNSDFSNEAIKFIQ